MPAYSFSAPEVTEQDEIRERELLSDRERLDIQSDICGNSENQQQKQELCDEVCLKLIREAMETIPEADKREYMEAMELVPDLVERESDPLAFMRCENQDAWAAAKRLTMYWKLRKTIFGPDRAFLPMTLRGAMAEDMHAVEKRNIAILPDDNNGRAVIYYHRSRCFACGRSSGLCAAFYFMQVMSEKRCAQENGFVFLANFQQFDPYQHYDRIYSKNLTMLARECFPARMKAVHLYVGARVNPMTRLVLGVLKHISGSYIRLRMLIHWGTDRQVQAALGRCGLCEEEHVSFLLSGHTSKGYESFAKWMEERIKLEFHLQHFRN